MENKGDKREKVREGEREREIRSQIFGILNLGMEEKRVTCR